MARDLSREYLEETLAAAKRLLPGWQYAVLRQAAQPRAGGRSAHRPAPKRAPSVVQSLVFDRERFDAEKAKAWAAEHGYENGKVDETGESFRLRQEEPGDFQTFRTIELAPGVKAVLGIKGDSAVSKADKTGVIVGLWVPPEVAQALAIQGGELPDDMHITLAHLGDARELPPQAHELAGRVLMEALADQAPLAGRISGVGRFDGEDEAVLYASPDVPGLVELREKVVAALKGCGLPVSEAHGFDPHITMAYVPKGLAHDLPAVPPAALEFKSCKIAIGPVRLDVPFGSNVPNLDLALEKLALVEAECDKAAAAPTIAPEALAAIAAIKLSLAEARSQIDRRGSGPISWRPLPWGLEPQRDCACKADLPAGALATSGPEGAALLFIGAAPTPLDAARGEPLTGPAGAAFRDEYLARLGLTKTDVAVSHLVPTAAKHGEPSDTEVVEWSSWIRAEIARVHPRAVVALGKMAQTALGELADFALPHPSALRKGDTRGEVARKLKAIQKALTESSAAVTQDPMPSASVPIQGASDRSSSRADTPGDDPAKARTVVIAKADRAKQVVYGVVLDPYTVDTQNDWAPPAEIESTGHRWLSESRVIGLEHKGKAAARPVESFMVPYPSPEDYQRAMRNEPHKALRVKLGNQEVGSGAWVIGVRVDDPKTWAKVESGELDAFSIGGFSERKPVTRAAMPKVEFV